MKKIFSIVFAMLILASGMHFTIATHFCGGEIASKKLSFTGSEATCGMEESAPGCASPVINTNCCKNNIDSYSISTNYENAVYKISGATQNLLHDLYVPLSFLFNSFDFSNLKGVYSPPPDIPLASDVNLAKICIFRI